MLKLDKREMCVGQHPQGSARARLRKAEELNARIGPQPAIEPHGRATGNQAFIETTISKRHDPLLTNNCRL